MWTLIWAIGAFVIQAATNLIYDAARTAVVLWVGFIVTIAFGATISYVVYSRSLAVSNGTIGMRQMGLRIIGAETHEPIGKSQAFRRSIIPLVPPVLLNGLSWFAIVSGSRATFVLALAGSAITTVVVILGGLWMLVSERRQTLWDIVGHTTVVVEREPSWLAVGELIIGLMVPVAAAFTLLVIGVDRLQSEYERLSGVGNAGRYLLYCVPAFLVALVAIVLGHVAVRSTRWEANRLAGAGLARTGLYLGYAFPILAVVIVVLGVALRQIEDRDARSCKQERALIAEAAASYQRLNGAYPQNASAVSGGIYANDEKINDTWTLTINDAAQPPTVLIVGKGRCAKA